MAWTRDLPRNHWGPWLSAAHARPRRSSTQTASDRAKKDLQKGRVPQICARPRVNAPAAMQEGGADARKVFGGDRAAYIYPATAGNMHRPPARRARHPHPPRHVQQGPRLRGSDTQLAPARPRSSRQHAPAAGAPCSWTSTVRMPLCACADSGGPGQCDASGQAGLDEQNNAEGGGEEDRVHLHRDRRRVQHHPRGPLLVGEEQHLGETGPAPSLQN